MTGEYVTEVSELTSILKELRAIRRLLENQDNGDVGQVKVGGTEYHFNDPSAKEADEIFGKIKEPRL